MHEFIYGEMFETISDGFETHVFTQWIDSKIIGTNNYIILYILSTLKPHTLFYCPKFPTMHDNILLV